jgi:hypothetical protein
MQNDALVFKTKIGIGLLVFLLFFLGTVSTLTILQQQYGALYFLMPLTVFLVYFVTAIHYVIEGNTLFIQCRGFYKYAIPVDSIRKIEEIRSMLSSPAGSTDRLEIFYNKYDSVVVSPKNKSAFIRALKERKPEIEVFSKNK